MATEEKARANTRDGEEVKDLTEERKTQSEKTTAYPVFFCLTSLTRSKWEKAAT